MKMKESEDVSTAPYKGDSCTRESNMMKRSPLDGVRFHKRIGKFGTFSAFSRS